MAYCPLCGNYWMVRTGRRLTRSVLGRSSNDVDVDPPEMDCPTCRPPRLDGMSGR